MEKNKFENWDLTAINVNYDVLRNVEIWELLNILRRTP